MNRNTKTYSYMEKRLSFLNTTLLSAALVIFLNMYFVLKVPFLLIVLLAAGFTLILHILFRYKNNPFIYCIIIAGILAGIVILCHLCKFNIMTGFYKVYRWCLSYDGASENYVKAYGFVIIIGLQLGSCLLFYLLGRIKYSKIFLAVFLPVLLILAAVSEVNVSKLTIVVIFYYSLSVLSEVCGKKFSKSKNVAEPAQATMYLMPFCVLIAIIAVSMPAHPEPIKWQGFKKLVKQLDRQGTIFKTKIEYLFDWTGTEFGLRYAGYSEENKELGGEIKAEHKTTLFLKTKKQSTAKGYLIGAISDTYTGRKWEKSKAEDSFLKEEYVYDFYELLSFFTKVKEAGIDTDNLIQKRNFSIEYNDIKTRSLFYPLKTRSITSTKKFSYQETSQGGILFDKAKGIGTKYEVEYYELNLKSNLLKKLLKEAENYKLVNGKESFLEALEKESKKVFYYDFSKSGLSIDQMELELQKRSASIKKQYTKLPKELPDRVRLLAKELTKGLETDYEKLEAIEAYLNTLTYTTAIEKTPKGEDFVDYFLFEQQKGYCTYFATAMGILARCANIPVRYVEGFVVDYEAMESGDTYKVLSSNAHSWIEGYIKGVGWIPFEPTPTFTAQRYAKWEEKSNRYADIAESSYPAGSNEMPDFYQDMVEGIKDNTLQEAKATNRKSYLPGVLGVIAGILFLTVSVFFVYYCILIKQFKQKFKKASANEKLLFLFQELLRYLGKEGYRLMMDETLNVFSERIGKRICYDTVIFSDIAEIFMKARYGNCEVSEKELDLVTRFLTQYRENLKEKQGKLKMFFDRFLYLHFSQ